MFLDNCTLTKKLLTFFSTLIIPLQDLVVLSFYIFFTYFLSILEIKKPNTTKSQKFWHHKRKVCLSRRKNHDCWTGKKPWCGDATCNYNTYGFGMAAICRLLYFVLFCLYLIVYTATNKTNNVLLLWTRYILIWRELSLALILKRILER